MKWFRRIFNFLTGRRSSRSVESRDKNDLTALHVAVGDANFSQVRKLISNGYDVNARDNTGHSPLHYLITHSGQQANITDVLSCLVANGADVNAKDNMGLNVIFTAVVMGKPTAILEQLLYHGAKWMDLSDRGLTILHLAAICNNLEALEYFISLGTDVDARSLGALTPLIMVVGAPKTGQDAVKYLETITLLIKKGADLNAKCVQQRNVLMHAVYNRNSENVLKMLVDKGAEWKNSKDIFGSTVVHASVYTGNLEALEYFESIGANTNEPGPGGLTPMHLAAASIMDDDIFLEIVHYLLRKGGKIEEKDSHGNSVLFTAVLGGKNKSSLEGLLLLGATWDRKAENGKGILEVAVLGDNLEAFNLFVERGANVHATNADGESVFNSTLLSVATENGAEMRKMLEGNGVVIGKHNKADEQYLFLIQARRFLHTINKITNN